MANIIFIFFLVFEIAFAIYCLRTKGANVMVRCYLRLAAFIMFLILCVTKIIVWDMRWYLLGALLLFLAVRGAYVLIISKRKIRKFSRRNIILKAFSMILLSAVALVPAFLFPQYEEPEPTGKFGVATAEFTYTSDTITDYFTGGKRQVNLGFWYPENADGKYPLLVFSHGAFGIRDSNFSAFEELASHGYVVCSIDHPGHSFYTKAEDGHVVTVNRAYMNEVVNSNKDDYYTKEEVYGLIEKWMKIRTEDINFTIDTILENVSQSSALADPAPADAEPEEDANSLQTQQDGRMKLYQIIDSNKIGVFGHSMGAAASVWIGRERADVNAVINIDGPYFSEMVYDAGADEFVAVRKPYDTPILNIYSDQVWVQLQDGTDTGVYAGNKISDQICAESYDVYLKGTKHLTLTDLSLSSPFLAYLLNGEGDKVDAKESIRLENRLILEFFDDVLKGDGKFSSEGVYGE